MKSTYGEPHILFERTLDKNLDDYQKPSWMRDHIKLCLSQVHLFKNNGTLKAAINQSLLARWNEITAGFDNPRLTNKSIDLILGDYLRQIQDSLYQKVQVTEAELQPILERIEHEVFEAFTPGSTPNKINTWIIHVKLYRVRSEHRTRSFQWKGTPEQLDTVRKYWIDNKFIDQIDIEEFSKHFDSSSESDELPQIIWIDKGKANQATPGTLLNFISILEGLDFLPATKKAQRIDLISSSFKLSNNATLIFKNSKVLGHDKQTKKMMTFSEFLQNIPPLST